MLTIRKRPNTYSSAKHSISNVELGEDEIVVDVEAALSSSERTATITAAMSYIPLGQSLMVLSKAYEYVKNRQ